MENYCFGTLVFEMDMLNIEHGFFSDHIVREKFTLFPLLIIAASES